MSFQEETGRMTQSEYRREVTVKVKADIDIRLQSKYWESRKGKHGFSRGAGGFSLSALDLSSGLQNFETEFTVTLNY